MESIPIPKRRTERVKSTQTDILDNIFQEYCLKRNNFNPKGPSPKIFVSKLQRRMKIYYKD